MKRLTADSPAEDKLDAAIAAAKGTLAILKIEAPDLSPVALQGLKDVAEENWQEFATFEPHDEPKRQEAIDALNTLISALKGE